MQARPEPLTPWLACALALGAVLLAVVVAGGGRAMYMMLTVALAAAVTAAALVSARVRARERASLREHLQRPTAEQLLNEPPPFRGGGRAYVTGMLAWVDAMIELLGHMISIPERASTNDVGDLASQLDDATALHSLLTEAAVSHPSNIGMARLHSICTLWELDQPRLEAVAAEIDGDFHRRWRVRTVIVRRLRRGDPAALRSLTPDA